MHAVVHINLCTQGLVATLCRKEILLIFGLKTCIWLYITVSYPMPILVYVIVNSLLILLHISPSLVNSMSYLLRIISPSLFWIIGTIKIGPPPIVHISNIKIVQYCDIKWGGECEPNVAWKYYTHLLDQVHPSLMCLYISTGCALNCDISLCLDTVVVLATVCRGGRLLKNSGGMAECARGKYVSCQITKKNY